MVSGESNGNISIWNSETCDIQRILKGHTRGVLSLKVLKNGTLASGSYDNKIKIWNPQNGQLLKTLEGHKDCVKSLKEMNNDQHGWLVSASKDKTVKMWNLESGDLLKSVEMPDMINQLVVLRDGLYVVIQFCNLDQMIIVNGQQSLKEERRIKCGKINEITLLQDGNLATSKENINIWDSSSGILLRTLECHKDNGGIWCLYLLDDGSLASGSRHGEIHIWNVTSGQLVQSFKAHDNWVSSMTNLNDACLVSCSWQCEEIKIWE